VGVLASAFLATVALLALAMPERNFRPTPCEGRSSWARMGSTARGGARLVRARPVLWMLLIIAAFSGMSSEGFDRLWEAHLLKISASPHSAAWIRWSGSV
jgi:MFS transporter, DHA3 family, tetracycline resistance protein